MPVIYLSPSTQEFNEYITGGSEEYWMNLLADAMEPILTSSGIRYIRNTPDMTAASSILASNAGNYGLHLALHSNASGEGQAGQNRGILAFYYPGSAQGLRAAQLLVDGKTFYLTHGHHESPEQIRRVRAPSVLLELGYHDNYEDAVWITSHIDAMAENLVLSLTEFFGIPFFRSSNPLPGVVQVEQGALNVHERPAYDAPVIARLYNGTQVTVLNEYYGWYLIQMGDLPGYAAANFIQLL